MLNKCKILLHCRTLSIYDSELKNVSSIILQSSAYNHLVFEKKNVPLEQSRLLLAKDHRYYLTLLKKTVYSLR